MPQYEVAGLIINIESDTSKPLEFLGKFLHRQSRDADLNFSIQANGFIEVPEGIIVANDYGTTVKKKTFGQGGYYIYRTDFGGKIMALVQADQDWRNFSITYCESIKDRCGHLVHGMIGVAFRYSLFNFNGLVIHSSTLKWQGKGLVFSAPSETGKSTQVRLWQKYLDDVTVLNDDTPAVRMINNKPHVFGTSWSGSKSIHSNGYAPLAAIILLEQAPSNAIRRLTNHQEVILKLLPRVFLPYFDQYMVRMFMDIFEKLMLSVPIYFLQCRPDKEAMELVYECVK